MPVEAQVREQSRYPAKANYVLQLVLVADGVSVAVFGLVPFCRDTPDLTSRSVGRCVETEAVIVRNTSSLVVLGRDGATAAAVTAATGLIPTSSTEAGEQPPRGSQRRYSTWHLTVESSPEDQSGFASMRALLLRILPAAPALRALEVTHELRIDWGGFSDSGQGGFVLEPDIARGLAELDLPVYGTTYVD